MGRFDKLNEEDDVLTPGPVVPPPEPRVRPVGGNPFAQVAPFRALTDIPVPSMDELLELADEHGIPEEGDDDLPTDPRQWLFAIRGGEDIGDLIICFTPVAYWEEYDEPIDTHVTDAIGTSLPSYLANNEEMEATFLLSGAYGPNQRTREQVVTDLLTRGFQQDPHFTSYIERS